jgi:hypothetical protein
MGEAIIAELSEFTQATTLRTTLVAQNTRTTTLSDTSPGTHAFRRKVRSLSAASCATRSLISSANQKLLLSRARAVLCEGGGGMRRTPRELSEACAKQRARELSPQTQIAAKRLIAFRVPKLSPPKLRARLDPFRAPCVATAAHRRPPPPSPNKTHTDKKKQNQDGGHGRAVRAEARH